MKYSLKIIQSAGDEKSVVAVDADGSFFGGALQLSYQFDGAEYALLICAQEMTQKRTGEVSLQMDFVGGKVTKCLVSGSEGSGSFNIYTENYSARFEDGGCDVECTFSDGVGGERTRIEIAARRLG